MKKAGPASNLILSSDSAVYFLVPSVTSQGGASLDRDTDGGRRGEELCHLVLPAAGEPPAGSALTSACRFSTCLFFSLEAKV